MQFFYVGKVFCLRGVSEHYKIVFSQLLRGSNPDRYTYLEFGSKNHTGGIADNSASKVVTIVATTSPRCPVKLLDLYHTKVPNVAKDSSFYLTPLPFTPTGSRPWFFEEKLPLKRLQGLLKKMCCDAKVEGNFTNHSLRATGTTTLFDAGVPEAIIQKRTGHKSLDALRVYERVTPQQESAVSRILSSNKPLLYATAKENSQLQLTPTKDTSDDRFLDSLPAEAFCHLP